MKGEPWETKRACGCFLLLCSGGGGERQKNNVKREMQIFSVKNGREEKKKTWKERMHSFFSSKSDDAFRFCPPSPYMSVGVRSGAAATVEWDSQNPAMLLIPFRVSLLFFREFIFQFLISTLGLVRRDGARWRCRCWADSGIAAMRGVAQCQRVCVEVDVE